MGRLSTIRLATYGLLVVIMVMVHEQTSLISVFLSDSELRDEAVEAELKLKKRTDEIETIVNSPGFIGARRSGSELHAIASQAAAGYGAKLSEFHRPAIRVSFAEGRLVWGFYFGRNYGPGVEVHPAEVITILIDDETGAATVSNETARM